MNVVFISMTADADIPRREYYQQVIAELPPLQRLMLDLEIAVLQKAPELIVQQYHHMPDTLEKWLEQPGGNPIWYMADGGYSRVVWSTETGNLFLTYNSTSKAKANWDSAKPQREALSNYLKAEYERLLGHPREWRESRAQQIVNILLDMRAYDRPPPHMPLDQDAELEMAEKSPFTAYDLALRRGHNPRLWAKIKGSVYEPEYRRRFNVGESKSPPMKALKKGRRSLTPQERREVVRKGAVWDDGSPGVWKATVNGETWFVCNTHRAAQVKPTLKGAIRAFRFVKTTS